MVDAMIPVLNPAGVQELLDYGIYGWALSRYSGCWVGLKCMKDTIDASASVEVNPEHVQVQIPADYALPPGGLSIRCRENCPPCWLTPMRLSSLRSLATRG
jgi:indolepyruvate ferredoxin oxidoreductase